MDGLGGQMAELYDVFVDWKGRLGREMPGLSKRLRGRVLDVGCGTGRHVGALLEAGFDAHGADVSEEMLARARAWTGEPERFFRWRLGDPPPDLEPFDSVICLGNTWPQVVEDVDEAHAGLRAVLKPRGRLLLGLKAVAIRRESGDPYLPLLRREHEGKPIYFIRFVEFEGQPDDLCEFHIVVVSGEEVLVHRTGAMRIWSPETLAAAFSRAGFLGVEVSGRIDDPGAAPATEDVFLHANAP